MSFSFPNQLFDWESFDATDYWSNKFYLAINLSNIVSLY